MLHITFFLERVFLPDFVIDPQSSLSRLLLRNVRIDNETLVEMKEIDIDISKMIRSNGRLMSIENSLSEQNNIILKMGSDVVGAVSKINTRACIVSANTKG